MVEGQPGATPLFFQGAFDLELLYVESPGISYTAASNCILIPPQPLVRGTATATWQASSPATEELSLAMIYGDGHEVFRTGQLVSPIMAEFGSANATEDDGPYMLRLAAQTGVAARQSATLELTLEYLGEPIEPVVSACTFT